MSKRVLGVERQLWGHASGRNGSSAAGNVRYALCRFRPQAVGWLLPANRSEADVRSAWTGQGRGGSVIPVGLTHLQVDPGRALESPSLWPGPGAR